MAVAGALALLALAGCPGFGVVQICPAQPPGPEERAAIVARMQATGPIAELMAAVEELERCGSLDAVNDHVTAHATEDVRLRLALMLVQTVGRGWATDNPIKVLLFKAQALPEADLHGLLRWTVHRLARQGAGEELLALIDEPLSAEAEARILAGAPAHVPAGPWRSPRGQPFWLFIGNEVHKAIGLYYEAQHKAEEVWLNHFPLSSILQRFARMGVGPVSNVGLGAFNELAIRPDITNLTTREVYEIKPLAAAPAAARLVTLYVQTFATYGVTVRPGSPVARGTSGVLPGPGGHILFHAAAPGVIAYQYRRGDYRRVPTGEPVPVPIGSRAPVDVRSRARAPASADDDGFWETMERVTGLTGWALTIYVILSEGSRIAFPPRNAIPIP